MDDKVKDRENLGAYVIILDKRDNVGTALKDIPAGKYLLNDEESKSVIIDVREPVLAGFKVSLCQIKKGESVYKYGYAIGTATSDINAGDKVHIENMKSLIK